MALWTDYFQNAELVAGIGYGASFDTDVCNGRVVCYNGDQSDTKFLDQ